ncbi:MAG: 5-(carboxyamino)imidazole ribonucleotide mutase [Candidatus Omnitrophica bacterium]|nr:5-(carboxyamino)imidazole ribonucleotide mutase [Candidatus Omnitrophota bacterium]
MKKPIVAIMMGSDSDLKVMGEAGAILKKFDVPYEIKVLSAHRTPEETIKYAKSAGAKGIKVIIAGAGGAAHLAGVVAAHALIPVIGVPLETEHLGGIDSLLSTVQMPSGVPVGCMAIGSSGAKNAALFALGILSLSDKKIYSGLEKYRNKLTNSVLAKNKR